MDWPEIKYVVGQYGTWPSGGPLAAGQSPGYPVFQVYSDRPGITHACAWFISEDEARKYADWKNENS